MIKAKKLNKNDKIAIVSLSRGLLGEPFIKHELDLGIKRLEEFSLNPVIMPNALKGMAYLEEHPEARASDLKEAFKDDSIKAIICAIGGNDTYKLLPYLMEDKEFIELVKTKPKIFTGFSDSTINHLMLYRIGLNTFYGPCLLVDLAELDTNMLPYTKMHFEKFFKNEKSYEIKISDKWYLDREDYSEKQLGISRTIKEETHGYEVISGSGTSTGILYGGCIESICSLFLDEEVSKYNEKYNIFLSLDELKDKILFLETSEEKPTPDKYKTMLEELKNRNILSTVKGVIIGKPIDEYYYEEYKEVLKEVFNDIDTPVLYNVNFGHSVPRCIIPYGVEATIDYDQKTIIINEPLFEE